MSKLLMLKGLTASGKSTYAKELVSQGWKRWNKDDMRGMIDSSKWSKDNEALVIALRNNFLDVMLPKYNVVVDDTNFYEGHEEVLKAYASMKSVDFEVKYFDTPVLTCIERDLQRGKDSVGKAVIWGMYKKYVVPNINKPKYQKKLKDAFIFDIDGTLALMKDRSPYEWDRVDEDYVNEHVALVYDALQEKGYEMIVVSGRDSICRDKTIDWLTENNMWYTELYMREKGDKRKDTIIKREIYENNIKGKYNILGIFDDRDSVVEMWRELGLTCHQVAYGSF